jgi:hypothetical protein
MRNQNRVWEASVKAALQQSTPRPRGAMPGNHQLRFNVGKMGLRSEQNAALTWRQLRREGTNRLEKA